MKDEHPLQVGMLCYPRLTQLDLTGPYEVLSRMPNTVYSQKHHPISRCDFFQPIFMVQPAENILDSDSAGGWQLTALNCRSRYWFPTKIWNAWAQAGVWAFLIVVGNPVPQDRSKMLLTEGDHVVQALAADGPHQPFTVGIGLRRL